MSRYLNNESDFYFIFPIDGDCLNENDAATPDPFTVKVKIKAPENARLTVNGKAAKKTGKGVFEADVALFGWENFVTAEDETSKRKITVTVFRLAFRPKSFRISSDDNIIFLSDLTAHKDEYNSIFDNPYLAVYKKAHDLYGAKVHLNLFYEFDEGRKRFSGKRERFDLSMMTDRFKDEFAANSDWLKLAFHAYAEFPDKPYQFETAEKITSDAALVNREIIRFAGKESIPDTTTVHFGEASPECMKALRSMGYRSLTGYFEHTEKGEPLVAYYYPDDLIDHVGGRDFWYDKETDMFFGRIDLVLNVKPHNENVEIMKRILSDPGRSNFISIMIHEQYFYPDYVACRPDFEVRVLDVCKMLYENGYKGCHISDAVKEPSLKDVFKA